MKDRHATNRRCRLAAQLTTANGYVQFGLINFCIENTSVQFRCYSRPLHEAFLAGAHWRQSSSLPAFHGHAGNISVNYSVYGYVESNDRH